MSSQLLKNSPPPRAYSLTTFNSLSHIHWIRALSIFIIKMDRTGSNDAINDSAEAEAERKEAQERKRAEEIRKEINDIYREFS